MDNLSKLPNDRWVIVPYSISNSPYPKEFIIKTLKRMGFTNIRESYNFGWKNQPKVVTFTATGMKLNDFEYRELNKALNFEHSLNVRFKDW